METGLPVREGEPDASFLNFLRGMETERDQSRCPDGEPFLNFLRGMETLYALNTAGGEDDLPKLP